MTNFSAVCVGEKLTTLTSTLPTADTCNAGFTPSLASREGGWRIFSAHFAAAPPRLNDAVPAGDVTLSVPSRAVTLDISLNGIDSRKSALRNWRTSVSRRALPSPVRPLNVAVQTASAPIG